jgi:serine/threonine protein kinase
VWTAPQEGTHPGRAKGKMIGRTLDGRFTILSLLGVGSMGAVYRARQSGTERDVAVKVLRKSGDPSSKARFLREAHASSSLVSPHTVRVFDFGETATGELFLVMELLEGESLAQRLLARKRLPVEEAVEATLQALKSLGEAHAKGLVHRDLKPANIFFAHLSVGDRSDEIVKILDFGGAKFIAPGGKALNEVDTQEGFVVGTPRYMSPEQSRGGELDARSDLYSLGIVLYHVLTGDAPFSDDDPLVVLAHHLRDEPERPSLACPSAEIPEGLEGLILRLLSKDPGDRPSSAEAMADELEQFTAGPRSSLRKLQADSLEDAAPVVSTTPIPAMAEDAATLPLAPASTQEPRRRSLWVLAVVAAGAGLLALASGVWRPVTAKLVATHQSAVPATRGAGAPSPASAGRQAAAREPPVPSASSASLSVDALPRSVLHPPPRFGVPARRPPSAASPADSKGGVAPAAPPVASASPPAPAPSTTSRYRYFE